MAGIPRKSTGGRAPTLQTSRRIQQHSETIITANRIPCTISWTTTIDRPNRTRLSIQIYDTTPTSNKTTASLAQKLEDDYFGLLQKQNEHRDRLDVYGLSMPEETTEYERIAQCIKHQHAEIAARESRGAEDLFIQRWDWHCYDNHEHFMLVIDRDDWEDSGMLFVSFDWIEREREEDEMGPELYVRRVEGRELTDAVNNMRIRINWEWIRVFPEDSEIEYSDGDDSGDEDSGEDDG